MTVECPWAERAALAVDEPSLSSDIATHLEVCESCRQLLANLTADRELVAAAPVIPDHVLEDVTSAVHRRIAQERQPRWRYAAVLAIAAGLLFAFFKIPVRQAEPIAYSRPTPPAVDTFRPEVPKPVLPTKRVVHRKLHRRVTPPAIQAALIDGKVVVRKQTADPNVVIFLVGEGETGGGDE